MRRRVVSHWTGPNHQMLGGGSWTNLLGKFADVGIILSHSRSDLALGDSHQISLRLYSVTHILRLGGAVRSILDIARQLFKPVSASGWGVVQTRCNVCLSLWKTILSCVVRPTGTLEIQDTPLRFLTLIDIFWRNLKNCCKEKSSCSDVCVTVWQCDSVGPSECKCVVNFPIYQ